MAARTDRAAVLRQMERILAAPAFRNAVALRQFLEFVVAETLEGRGEHIKETVIAVEVFGRPASFNSRTDNVVRVQAHRLRTKLGEYYADSDDPLIIDIPKGHYVPTFEWAGESPDEPEPHNDEPAAIAATAAVQLPRRWLPVALLAAGILAGALGAWGWERFGGQGGDALDPDLAAFWDGFLDNATTPTLLVFPTHRFLRTEQGHLIRHDGPEFGPTGAWADPAAMGGEALAPQVLGELGRLRYHGNLASRGDAQSLYELTRFFTAAEANFLARNSRLLSLDQIRTHDVVYIGSDFANDTMAALSGDLPFSFDAERGIVNHRPEPGEPASYQAERDSETGVRTLDYGLISVLPGLAPDRKVAILGGIRTEATWGAAQMATQPEYVRELAARFGGDWPEYFQALIRCRILKEQVAEAEIVSVRRLDGQRRLLPTPSPALAVR